MNDQASLSFDASAVSPTVVHDCPEWFVVNKPIGWHSVAARVTDGSATIQAWIAANYPAQCALPESGLVHRLDVSTSGCLLVAKSERSYEDLRENFSAGVGGWSIAKKYLALATPGLAQSGEFTLFFSSRHKGSAKVTVHEVGSRNERGVCRWKVLRASDPQAAAGDPTTFDLIEVELIGAGRRHQIRAGLSSLGHPLAGDLMYRGAPLNESCNHSFAALHAWKIVVTGIEVESAPPQWA